MRLETGDRGLVGKGLCALISRVAEHVASEEASCSKDAYPDAAAHKAIHDKLVATCLDLQKQLHAGQAEITGETANLVVGWLADRIPGADEKYGPFSNAKGVA